VFVTHVNISSKQWLQLIIFATNVRPEKPY
jgi:hypothetical protein